MNLPPEGGSYGRKTAEGTEKNAAMQRGFHLQVEDHILYLPMSSGSRLSSHFCSRSASPFSGAKSTVLALSITRSSTKIGARARSASAIASLGRASIAIGS